MSDGQNRPSSDGVGSLRATRACDGCRVRKVKCDGAQPCSQCAHFNVPCVASQPLKKRKNPVRGRLVARVRGDVDNDRGASGFSLGSKSSRPTLSVMSIAEIIDRDRQALSPFELLPTNMPYNLDFFTTLVPQFEERVYPVNPIIPSDELIMAIANIRSSLEDAALVYAFAAATIFLTRSSDTMHVDVITQMNDLMQHSLEAHKRADLKLGPDGRMIEEPPISIKRIMTCIFLEISMMAFKRYDRSFTLLREAITMIQTLRSHDFPPGGHDTARYQRLYWEAFIHERFLTIASGYPSILPPLRTALPENDPSLPPYISVGFSQLIRLFLVIDRPFLAYWGEQQDQDGALQEIDAEWIEQKQAQLDEDEIVAAEEDQSLRSSGRGALKEFQRVDIFVTRLWIRTLVWQLALSRGLLRSDSLQSTHDALSLQFPAQRLSTQLRDIVSRLESAASISTQGSGIMQKLFEITSTIADVLALPLGHGRPEDEVNAQVQDFILLVKFLFHFERVREEQKDYLREKVIMLQQLYPGAGDEENVHLGLG